MCLDPMRIFSFFSHNQYLQMTFFLFSIILKKNKELYIYPLKAQSSLTYNSLCHLRYMTAKLKQINSVRTRFMKYQLCQRTYEHCITQI